MRCRKCYVFFFLGLGLLATMGCGDDGPEMATVTGVVTYQDKPLGDAYVSFLVEGAPVAVAQTNSEGRFTISEVPVGEAKISVSKMEVPESVASPSGTSPEDMRKMYMEKMNEKPTKDAGPKSAIPQKYADPKQSGLTANVTSDSSKNDFKFELK